MAVVSSTAVRYWAVVPAAGYGRRMGQATPKQYLPLAKQPVLWHTLRRLSDPSIAGVIVAIAPDDRQWARLDRHDLTIPIQTVVGGRERCHSVLNALNHLSGYAHPQDWVLVHDAARPCLRHDDLITLMTSLASDPVGGILALPARDTMKRGDAEQRVTATVDRNGLWHALTPQMFRLQLLRDALQYAIAQNQFVTDEAMAIELAGYTPRLIEGQADNIKITRQADLALAEFYLTQQSEIHPAGKRA